MATEEQVKCPECGAVISAGASRDGSRCVCESCGTSIVEAVEDDLASAKTQAVEAVPDFSTPTRPLSREEVRRQWAAATGPGQRQDETVKTEPTGATAPSRITLHDKDIGESGARVESPPEYELLNVLGEGGMGIVRAARQSSMDRIVAVKMLKPEKAGDPDYRSKFLAEAAVTGELDHPNVVPVHDLGRSREGDLFYAMKEVRGNSWKNEIEKKSLSENLEIWLNVCNAVAFAHSRGVVHRDLKPENVMLGEFGEVLVMDWGLAVLLQQMEELGAATGSSPFGGTPSYMPPEIARGEWRSISERSDIYLLGGILYQIVTDNRPHVGTDQWDCIERAGRNEISPTDESGELVDIALKAMSTRPEDRHQSVQELQAEVRSYQAHSESIALSARAGEIAREAEANEDYEKFTQATFAFREALDLWENNAEATRGVVEVPLAHARCAYRKGDLDLAGSLLDPEQSAHEDLARKVDEARGEREARRKRLKTFQYGSFSLAACVFLLLGGGFFWIRAEKNRVQIARDRAEVARDREAQQRRETERALAQVRVQKRRAEREKTRAQRANYYNLIGLAARRVREGAFAQAQSLLADLPPDKRGWAWGRMMMLASREAMTLREETVRYVRDMACTGDGHFVALCGPEKTTVWNVPESRRILTIEAGGPDVAFGPTGKLLLIGRRAYQMPGGKEAFSLPEYSEDMTTVCFDGLGRRIAAGYDDGEVVVFSVPSGEKLFSWRGHDRAVVDAAFTPEGRYLATGGRDNVAKLWGAEGKLVATFRGHKQWVTAVEFTPDGRRLITGSRDATARVWTLEGTPLGEYTAHTGIFGRAIGHEEAGGIGQRELGLIRDIAVVPGGRWVVTAGEDRSARLWDADSLRSLGVPMGHESNVNAVSVVAQGRVICTATHDGTVKLWMIGRVRESCALRGHEGLVFDTVFDPTGKRILSASSDGTAKLWDVETGRELMGMEEHDAEVRAASFSSDGRTAATGDRDGAIYLWDVSSGGKAVPLKKEGDAVIALAFGPEGRRLAVGYWQQPAELWDVGKRSKIRILGGLRQYQVSLDFSPDGRRLAMAGTGPTCLVDVESGEVVRTFEGIRRGTVIAYSPDGTRLAVAGLGEEAIVWNVADGTRICTFTGHSAPLHSLAFTPLGRHVVTGDRRGYVKLWDAETAEEIMTVAREEARVSALAFGPDGKRLALGRREGVAILEAAPWERTVEQIRESEHGRLVDMLRE